MSVNREKAMNLFMSEDVSFVAVKGEALITSKGIGVKPIIEQLRGNQKALEGYTIVDKVIGKAAAMLLVLTNVEFVYGFVMSETAMEVLRQHHIDYDYNKKVAFIENRTHTGMCPLEDCVKDCEDERTAFGLIEARIVELMRK